MGGCRFNCFLGEILQLKEYCWYFKSHKYPKDHLDMFVNGLIDRINYKSRNHYHHPAVSSRDN